MNGRVDRSGRALITIAVISEQAGATHQIEAWIDTGFNGDLVLPERQIDELALAQSGTVKAILADGSEVALKTYSCLIEWFGKQRSLEVVANEGDFPLLGVGRLQGHDLCISYRTGAITID